MTTMMTTMMTRTGAWTTTETMAALLERVMDDLYARGIRALYSHAEECDFLFSRDASTTARVVAMAVRFYAEFGAVTAFTRGALCLSDNFDTVAGRVCAVENFAFGGAKTYIEHREAHAFVSDHMEWTDERVLVSLPKFAQMVDRKPSLEAAMEAHPEYRALSDAPDSSVARLRFLNALARRHMANVHREVLKFGRGKGIGLEDPVFAAASASEDSLATDENATLSHYFDARLSLLDHVPHANPRFAKLAFGRSAMWPLIEEAWTDLCEWTVFFVRRLQLARNPDLAYTFLMLNSGKESLHSETSPHDDDWATKLPVPKGLESPLDVLLPVHGDDAVAEALWERVRTAAPTRRLGRANALVAHSLLSPDASIEGKSAAAVALRATGWVAWVDRCLPGEGSLLSPPRLPFEADALPELRTWIEALRDGLVAREAAGELQRTQSRSLSQQ
jgi:hypothetical protein